MRSGGERSTRAPGRRRLAALILAACVLWLLQGCAAVTLQPAADPEDPVTVALLDHGHHSSLVLPAEASGAWLRYSYGDWAFYVERRIGPLQGLAGLLAPTRAALGRQVLTGSALDPTTLQQLRVPLEESHLLTVPGGRVEALRTELEDIWQAGYEDRRRSREWDMGFVEHPEAYTLRNNSNRMVARWLTALDVDVSRAPILSNWKLDAPRIRKPSPPREYEKIQKAPTGRREDRKIPEPLHDHRECAPLHPSDLRAIHLRAFL